MSDLRLEHPSISRRHSMFGHGSSGNLYVMDLGSSHGTFVNGKRLESKKREALHDGDVVKFGASTREYVVKLDVDSPDDKTNDVQAPPNKKQRLNDDSSKETKNNNEQDQNIMDEHHKNNDRRSLSNTSENNNTNTNDGHKQDEISCRHLLIKHKESRRPKSWKNPNITRSKQVALQMCQNLRKQLIDCDNMENKFSELAKSESDCNSAKRGGDLGKFGKGKMQKPFEEAAFALNIGQLSEPVDTDSGIHLILRTG